MKIITNIISETEVLVWTLLVVNLFLSQGVVHRKLIGNCIEGRILSFVKLLGTDYKPLIGMCTRSEGKKCDKMILNSLEANC